MMAVDMGGPVNKAAYVFGTGTLDSISCLLVVVLLLWRLLWQLVWFLHWQYS